MHAIELFLRDHARTHSATVGGAEGGLGFEDLVVSGMTDEQLRQRPQEGTNSLAWLLWHMARTEDMGVNLLVAGRTPVLEEEGWLSRLRLTGHNMGAGMSEDEVADVTQRLAIGELRAYRAAVGLRTKTVVRAMRPEELDEPIDIERVEQAYAEGVIGEQAAWVRGFVGGKTKAFVLAHTGSGHNFMHLGEAWCVRSLLGHRLPV
jgi:hypothetical protein